MNTTVKETLVTEIDKLARASCRLMTDDERECYFTYQEERRASNQALVTTYTVPIRTYYKGAKIGTVKQVYEVDGVIFEKLWDKLYKYAVKSAMGSHQSNHYNNPDVQNDVCDIRYQTFYVLRYFGPTPTGKNFSNFFLTIVNNILTTSARRRGVYREVSAFTNWFDEVKYEDHYIKNHQDYLTDNKEFVCYIDFMFNIYLDKYHKRHKDKILKALVKHDALMNAAFEIWKKSKRNKRFILKPFTFNVGNCESTMINYKASSIYEELGSDSDDTRYLADVLENESVLFPDTDPVLQNILDSLVDSADISVIDDEVMQKPIEMLIKGESITKIAKELNIKVDELRASLRGILPSLQ